MILSGFGGKFIAAAHKCSISIDLKGDIQGKEGQTGKIASNTITVLYSLHQFNVFG